MAECAFHPGVETEVRCQQCERPICPRDMVATPVGYKCPVCAKPKRSEYFYIKPKQLAGAIGFGLLAAVGGALLMRASGLASMGFVFLIVPFLYGVLVAEAVRRGAGGHRGPIMAGIAVGAILLGVLVGDFRFLSFSTLAAALGAVSDLSWTWGR